MTRGIIAILTIVALVTGIAWVAQGSEFFLHRFFTPRYEETRRLTFEHSRAFREGKAQEIARLRRAYAAAESDDQRDAVRSEVQAALASYPIDHLPAHLRGFANQMRGE